MHYWMTQLQRGGEKNLSYFFFISPFLSLYSPEALTRLPPLRCSLLQLRACLPACVYFWKLTTWPTCALLLLVHQHSSWPNKGSVIRNKVEGKYSFDRHGKHSNQAFVWINHEILRGVFHCDTIGTFLGITVLVITTNTTPHFHHSLTIWWWWPYGIFVSWKKALRAV